MFAVIVFLNFFLFIHLKHSRVTKKPPKMLIAASIIAKNPKILDISKISPDELANAAIIAPTIITDDIALVTDISGV